MGTDTPAEWLRLGAQLAQWDIMRDALADFCQAQNSNFKRDRWIDYINGECGPNGGKVK